MLERILGFMIGLVTGFIFLVGSVFAIPSMVRYAKIRAM
jgi:hypothetical protein